MPVHTETLEIHFIKRSSCAFPASFSGEKLALLLLVVSSHLSLRLSLLGFDSAQQPCVFNLSVSHQCLSVFICVNGNARNSLYKKSLLCVSRKFFWRKTRAFVACGFEPSFIVIELLVVSTTLNHHRFSFHPCPI